MIRRRRISVSWLKEQVSNLQVENQQVKQKAHDQEKENFRVLAEIQRANQHQCDHLFNDNQWLKEQVQVLKKQVSHFQVENQQVKHKPRGQEEVSFPLPVEFLREEWQDHHQDMVPRLSAENQRLMEQVHMLILAMSHHWAENKPMRQQRQDREEPVSRVLQETQKFGQSQAASGTLQTVKKILPALPSVPLGLSPGKVFHVQIRVAGKTGGAEKKFLKDIEKLLSGQSISLKLKEFTKTSKDLLLVFCPIASRMGTDIQNALEGLSGEQKAILVVMHYVQKDNTETFLDTRRREAHPALVRTVHTRYTLQAGFYPCEMNKAAVTAMADTIKGLAEDP